MDNLENKIQNSKKGGFRKKIGAGILALTLGATSVGCFCDNGGDDPKPNPNPGDRTPPIMQQADIDSNNYLTASATDEGGSGLKDISMIIDTDGDGNYDDETIHKYDGTVSVEKLARELGLPHGTSYNVMLFATDNANNDSDPVYRTINLFDNTAPTYLKTQKFVGGEWVDLGPTESLVGVENDMVKYRDVFVDREFDAINNGVVYQWTDDVDWPSTQSTTDPDVPNVGDVYTSITTEQAGDGSGQLIYATRHKGTTGATPRGTAYTDSCNIKEVHTPDQYSSSPHNVNMKVDPDF